MSSGTQQRTWAIAYTLPVYGTAFIGRERDASELRDAISTRRLVTLHGMGGSGKTRLAVEVGRQTHEEYPDGAWFTDLGAIPAREPELVPAAVLAALGERARPDQDPLDALIEHLQPRRALLIVDNCEHLVHAIGSLVSSLLRDCPYVRILATSRTPLKTSDEAVVPLEPLSLPTGDPDVASLQKCESARLFCERAVAARSTFRLTEENAAALSGVCARLDGLPLAIELAAARVKVLSVEQVDQLLADRFRLLASGRRDAPRRHQTLSALLDWSYDLLTEHARLTLRRAAVFVGGFDLDAAEAVCADEGSGHGDLLDSLAELVDASLIAVEERDGRVRYRMLETVREYAAHKLDELGDPETARARHLAWVRTVSGEAGNEIAGPRAHAWLQILDSEDGNLRAALDWTLSNQHGEDAIALAGDLWRYWHTRGRLAEGSRWLDLALDLSTTHLDDRARALNGAANLSVVRGDFGPARKRYEEALDLRRSLDDVRGVATTLNDLGTLHLHAGALEEAEAVLEECLLVAIEISNDFAEACARTNLADLALQRDDTATARTHLERALDVWRAIGVEEGIATCLLSLGETSRQEGKVGHARSCLRESLPLLVGLGHEPTIAVALQVSAAVERLAGEAGRAATLLGAAERLRDELGLAVANHEQEGIERETELVRAELGVDMFETALRRGRALGVADSVAFALGEPVAVEAEAREGATDVFRLEGEIWVLAFGGVTVQLRDAKGLSYIARLLARPGEEFHCAELVSVSSTDARSSSVTRDDGLVAAGPSHAGEILDPQARDAYRARLADLHDELNEAEAWNDSERGTKVREEMDAISAELSAAFGLGGRSRKASDDAERVRKAVTNRIRASIAKIKREHPELANHLARSVRTGTFCSYSPDEPTSWSVSNGS